MHIHQHHIQIFIAILISLIFSWASFEAGFYKAKATQSCDPFQIIRDQAHSPYPSINNLLKK
jgi:hypothetical protein